MAWICEVEDRDPFHLVDVADLVAHALASGLISDNEVAVVHQRLVDLVDRGLLGASDPLGSIDQEMPPADRARVMSDIRTTAEGRLWAEGNRDVIQTIDLVPGDAQDRRRIAVMHGRDAAARTAVCNFLRRLRLEPLEWDDLVNLTHEAAPYNGQAVAAAFKVAQAVVVVLTPDDIGFLHPSMRDGHEPEDDREPTGQARLNVVLEAGMALQSHPTRTVLVEIGRTRAISDLAGRNAVRLDGSAATLNSFATRLEQARCLVDRRGNDWLEAGEFAALAALTREPAGVSVGDPARPNAEPGTATGRRQLARRHAQHVSVELSTIDRTVDLALRSARWWNVAYEGLPAIQWNASRDVLADEVPTVYAAVASCYVEADQLNKAANRHAHDDRDDYDEFVAQQMAALRMLIASAKDALQRFAIAV